MAQVAEAIVVGGGVNGASTLFHLAERGVKAILLERGEIAGASTGKSGGLVRMHYTDPYQARLAHESLPYFADWKHRVGVGDPGFARTGFLQTVAEHNIPALYENVRMLQGIGVNTCIVTSATRRRGSSSPSPTWRPRWRRSTTGSARSTSCCCTPEPTSASARADYFAQPGLGARACSGWSNRA